MANLAAKTGAGGRSDDSFDDGFADSGIRGPVLRRADQRTFDGGFGTTFRPAARGVHAAAFRRYEPGRDWTDSGPGCGYGKGPHVPRGEQTTRGLARLI